MYRFLKKTLDSFLLFSAAIVWQPASAQFLDAASVRPILDATKANWVSVREFDGNDLVYFTHLLAWRCGLEKIEYGLNGADPDREFSIGTCDESSPNTIPEDMLVFDTYELKSVSSVTVKLTYDDGEVDTQTYERAAIQQ